MKYQTLLSYIQIETTPSTAKAELVWASLSLCPLQETIIPCFCFYSSFCISTHGTTRWAGPVTWCSSGVVLTLTVYRQNLFWMDLIEPWYSLSLGWVCVGSTRDGWRREQDNLLHGSKDTGWLKKGEVLFLLPLILAAWSYSLSLAWASSGALSQLNSLVQRRNLCF